VRPQRQADDGQDADLGPEAEDNHVALGEAVGNPTRGRGEQHERQDDDRGEDGLDLLRGQLRIFRMMMKQLR